MLSPVFIVQDPPILQLMLEERERLTLGLYGKGGWMVLQKHGLYESPVKVVVLGSNEGS